LNFALLTFNLSSVAAQTSQSVTITPPHIKLTLNPGEIAEGKLSIINNSSSELSFKVSTFDFIVTDNKGTPQILPPGTITNNRYSASNWIAAAPDTFTVKPHERFNFNYYAKVPKNAAPGGHYAAIVYQPVNDSNVVGSGASIQTQMATLVYFSVPGDIKESAIVKLFKTLSFQEYGPISIETEIKNQGDLHINPTGRILVSDLFGRTIENQDLEERNIFPEASLLYNSSFGQKVMFGRFKADLYAKYGKNNNLPLLATVYFWIFPWKAATITTLAITAIILTILLLRKRKQKQQEKKE